MKVGNYRDFFKRLSITELADLKKYVTLTVLPDETSQQATSKIIKMIQNEIAFKESKKNLTFM